MSCDFCLGQLVGVVGPSYSLEPHSRCNAHARHLLLVKTSEVSGEEDDPDSEEGPAQIFVKLGDPRRCGAELERLRLAQSANLPGADWLHGVAAFPAMHPVDPERGRCALLLPVCPGRPVSTLPYEPNLPRALAVVLPLLSVVATLHARGFTHGDLCSRNIHFDAASGMVHLVDWERLEGCGVGGGEDPRWASRQRADWRGVHRVVLTLLSRALQCDVLAVGDLWGDPTAAERATRAMLPPDTWYPERRVQEIVGLFSCALRDASALRDLQRALVCLRGGERVPLRPARAHWLLAHVPAVPIPQRVRGLNLYADLGPVTRWLGGLTLATPRAEHQRDLLVLLPLCLPLLILGAVVVQAPALAQGNLPGQAPALLVMLVAGAYWLSALAALDARLVLEHLLPCLSAGEGGGSATLHRALAEETAHHLGVSLAFAVLSTCLLCAVPWALEPGLPGALVWLCLWGRWIHYWLLCKPFLALRILDDVLRATYDPDAEPRLRARPHFRELFATLSSPGSLLLNLTAAAVMLDLVGLIVWTRVMMQIAGARWGWFQHLLALLIFAVPFALLLTFQRFQRQRAQRARSTCVSEGTLEPRALRHRHVLGYVCVAQGIFLASLLFPVAPPRPWTWRDGAASPQPGELSRSQAVVVATCDQEPDGEDPPAPARPAAAARAGAARWSAETPGTPAPSAGAPPEGQAITPEPSRPSGPRPTKRGPRGWGARRGDALRVGGAQEGAEPTRYPLPPP